MQANIGKVVKRTYTDQGLKALAFLILKTRAERGWSRRHFADTTGVAEHTIRRLESNIVPSVIRAAEPMPPTLDGLASSLITNPVTGEELTGHDLYTLCRGTWEIPAQLLKFTTQEMSVLKRSMPNLPSELCEGNPE